MKNVFRVWQSKNIIKVIFKEGNKKKLRKFKSDYYFCIAKKDFNKKIYKKLKKFKIQGLIHKITLEENFVRIYCNHPHKEDSTDLWNQDNYSYDNRNSGKNLIIDFLEEEGIETFEADLTPYRRWVIDNWPEFCESYSYCAFDFETDDSNGFPPGYEKGGGRILSYAITDFQTKKTIFRRLKKLNDREEINLIQQFLLDIQKYDILTGWNVVNFDFQFLRGRMEKFEISYDFRYHFIVDQQEVFKNYARDLDVQSWKLDDIAFEILQENKVSHDGLRFIDMWRDHQDLFEEYNKKDTILCLRLEERQKFLQLRSTICNLGKVHQDHTNISRPLDNMILNLSLTDGIRFKTKKKKYKIIEFKDEKKFIVENIESGEKKTFTSMRKAKEYAFPKFAGAKVLECIPGLYKDVAVLDFSALYPTMMTIFNISPETYIPKDEIKKWKKGDYCQTPKGTFFSVKTKGIFVKMFTETTDRRKAYQDEFKRGSDEGLNFDDPIQIQRTMMANAWKTLGLTLYGILGNVHSRYFNVECAESVTLSGRYFLMQTIKEAKGRKFGAIYGDSVTGSRPLFIKENDFVSLITFEELWEKMISKGHEVISDRDKEIIDLRDRNLLTISFGKSEAIWKQIKTIIRHKTSKQIYSVNTRYGHTEVTEDHSIMEWVERGHIQKCKPEDLKYGNSVVHRFPEVDMIRNKKFETIDLWEYLKEYHFKTHYKGKVKINNCSLVEDDQFIKFGWTNQKNPVLLRRFITSNEIVSLCKILGYYVAEGSASTPETTKSRIGAQITKYYDSTILEKIANHCRKIFKNSKCEIAVCGKNQDQYKLNMMNGISTVFFSVLCGQGAENKKIPDFIFNIPKKFQRVFFRYMLKGDGSKKYQDKYSPEYKESNFTYSSRSPRLIAGIIHYVNLMGRCYSLNYREDKKCYELKTSSQNRNTDKLKVTKLPIEERYVYDLSIEDTETFVDACGGILLHNTDSAFIQISSIDREEFFKRVHKRYERKIKKFNGFPGHLKLAHDKQFAKIVLMSKKCYAGTVSEMKERVQPKPYSIDKKGIAARRTDRSKYCKDLQTKILELFLRKKKKDISYYIKWILDKREAYMRYEFKVEDIMIAKTLKKPIESYEKGNEQHILVAKRMKELGEEVFVGQKILFFKFTTRNGKAVPLPISEYNGIFDRLTYWNESIYPSIRTVIEAVFPEYDWNSFLFSTNNKNTLPPDGTSFY